MLRLAVERTCRACEQETHLVTMEKLLVFSVRASCSPGPLASTRAGSQPSVADTLKGLLGTAE